MGWDSDIRRRRTAGDGKDEPIQSARRSQDGRDASSIGEQMTTDELMTLANDYANAETVFEATQKQQALRLAVEQLVADRYGLINALRGLLGARDSELKGKT